MDTILITNFGKTRCAAGKNSVERLPEELRRLKVKKPMIVTDDNIVNLPKFEKTLKNLNENGFEYIVFHGITPNPKDTEVMAAMAVYKEHKCDCVIGIGGGSSMDAAKGVSVMARHDGDIMDYGRSTPNRKFFVNGRETLICIPTTTGTGSELSPHAVITNTKKNDRKSDVEASVFYNDMFFLDPEFACTQPIETLRDTGIDALSHVIDSYTNKKMLTIKSPLHEAMTMQCIKLIFENLRKVMATGGADMDSVLNMQWAATFGGALLDLDASAMHGLSGILQKYRHGMTHGVSCGILMSACMEYNLQTCPEKFAQMAENMSVDTRNMTQMQAAKSAISAVEELLKDIEFPKFSDYEFTEEELEAMSEVSATNSMMPLNPRPIKNAEDVLKIYKRANER